ncbi:MAG: class I SAM-dependent methyltransferase [Legionellaceae bacterium]|nr:class I SAM-dependent methyltransferase [Legionellaceae bacterium]
MSIPLGFTVGNEKRAKSIANTYEFPIDNKTLPRLNLNASQLELLMPGFSPIFVDFSSKVILNRKISAKKQGIVRACKPVHNLTIVDVTAGWGRDAALLASLGAEVLMLERNAIMASLLEDGLERLDNDVLGDGSLNLLHVDAKSYLGNLEEDKYPDIIYIDPMHPAREKSALVKKDMQALQSLLGPDDDAAELIQLAIGRAKKRVVVKWPQKVAPLVKPKHSINGTTVRFDLY